MTRLGWLAMRVVFVSPHPDDIEIFCGGTLLYHYYRHDVIHVVMMTRGENGSLNPKLKGAVLRHLRTQEVENRYRNLATVSITWLDMIDGRVEVNQESIATMAKLLANFSPHIIYLPESQPGYATYPHSDHRHSANIVEQAVSPGNACLKLRYYHSKNGNTYIDVSPFIEESQQALRHYQSQYSPWNFPPFLLPLYNLWQQLKRRKQGKKNNCRYAELFREIFFKVCWKESGYC